MTEVSSAGGHIFTFYSYKGGVGRSMAMASIAEYFNLRGLQVVMIDWDLEAPGLETFFFPPPPRDAADPKPAEIESAAALDRMRSRLGLIDLLNEYMSSYDAFAEASDQKYRELLSGNLAPERYLQQIHPQEGAASLRLLTAGWRGERFSYYADAVQSFDWTRFYESFRGKDFFDWFASELKKLADVVLIDSRTGVTEMGGVCARHLADVVVALCAPNLQNLDGIGRMVASFDDQEVIAARNGRPLDALIVPARLENAETDRLTRFLEDFDRKVDTPEKRPAAFVAAGAKFRDLAVPYVTTYAFEEARVFGPGIRDISPSLRLEQAYGRLAIHMALLTPEAHPIRRQLAEDIRGIFPNIPPPVALSFAADAADAAKEIRSALTSAGVAVAPPAVRESWIPFAKFLVVVTTTEAVRNGSEVQGDVRLARGLGKHVIVFPGGAPLPPWLALTPVCDGIDDLLAFIRQPPPLVHVPNSAPAAEPLVGREKEVSTLKETLIKCASTGATSVALVGPPGYGKTALAASLCHDESVETAFPGGVLWLYARGLDSSGARQRLLDLLGEPSPLDPEKALGLRLGATVPLIVLDDCSDASLVRSLLALLTRGSVLVTTQRTDVAAGSGSRIDVGPLSLEAAQKLAGPAPMLSLDATVKDERRQLAVAIDGWPTGVLMVRRLLEQRVASGETAAQASAAIVASYLLHGISAFDVAAASAGIRSARETLDPAFRDLSAAGMTRRLIALSNRVRFGRFTLEEAGGAVGLDADKAAVMLQDLQSRSLVLTDGDGYSIHPLVAGYLIAEGHLSFGADLPRNRRFSSSRDKEGNADVKLAQQILAGRFLPLDEVSALASRLKASRYFSYARRLLLRARTSPDFARLNDAARLKFGHELAVCTYKDADLLPEQRFTRAIEHLNEVDDLTKSCTQETLGKAGAIYKYRWGVGGQRDHLERSLTYYERGYRVGILKDDGYTAINAAFILDLLASLEDEVGSADSVGSGPDARRARARTIRQEIVTALTEKLKNDPNASSWWLTVTLAEAWFGLGAGPDGSPDETAYSHARRWFREALVHKSDDWEYETAARQMAAIATLQHRLRERAGGEKSDEPEWRTLAVFVGNHAPALKSLEIGKVGVALSGGGIRASLFHIGVLARLAETDVLRHVQVLSCVSGGSIIGAYYYLELKQLLESRPDSSIVRKDYVDLVDRIEKRFLAAIQKNVRTRIATSPVALLRMVVSPFYNRTDRIAELYDALIFSEAGDGKGRTLDQLYITPHGETPESFAPKLDNWWRSAKVPELILNATTVNTGHSWQFTASWMGEPPIDISEEIDGNDRLRRMYYWEAPRRYRKVPLGKAVAASSCVPGVFEPLAMPGLYPDRVIRLADGGVHDNQGVSALVETECKVLIISDASGQMSSQKQPSTSLFSVAMRSNDMLMSRVRESQFRELTTRRNTGSIHDFSFVHLKKGLPTEPVDWIGCQDPYEKVDESRTAAERGPLTEYGVPKSVQAQLAAIRTDLDSFTQIESYALMYSGYRMIDHELRRSEILKTSDVDEPFPWPFLAIAPHLGSDKADAEISSRVNANLDVARSSVGKAMRVPAGRALMMVVLVGLLFGAYRCAKSVTPEGAIGLGATAEIFLIWAFELAAAGVVALVPVALALMLLRITGRRKALSQTLFSAFLFFLAWPVAWMHLLIFDRLYLNWGSLDAIARQRERRERWASSRWVTRGAVAVVVVLLASATWFVWSGIARESAERKRVAAQRSRAAALAHRSRAAADPVQALVLAVAAAEAADSPDSRDALIRAIRHSGLRAEYDEGEPLLDATLSGDKLITLTASGKTTVRSLAGGNSDVQNLSGLGIPSTGEAKDRGVAMATAGGDLIVWRFGEAPRTLARARNDLLFAVNQDGGVGFYTGGTLQYWSPYGSAKAPIRTSARLVQLVMIGDSAAAATADGALVIWADFDAPPIGGAGGVSGRLQPIKTRVFAHASPITSMATNIDGTLILTTGKNGTVRIWSTTQGYSTLERVAYEIKPIGMLRSQSSSIALRQSIGNENRHMMLIGHDGLHIWPVAQTGTGILFELGSSLSAAALDPTGPIVVAARSDGPAILYRFKPDFSVLEEKTALTPDGERVTTAAFSPDGEQILTVSSHGTVRVFWANAPTALPADGSGLLHLAKSRMPITFTKQQRINSIER